MDNTYQQIQDNLIAAKLLIQAVLHNPEYLALQDSEDFSTSNDLVLDDAILTITEVMQGVDRVIGA
jgi:hypothetical protein